MFRLKSRFSWPQHALEAILTTVAPALGGAKGQFVRDNTQSNRDAGAGPRRETLQHSENAVTHKH